MTDSSARYLADYQVAQFSIATINLTFELSEQATKVTNVMAISRQDSQADKLILDGEQLTLMSLHIDQLPLAEERYEVTDNTLTIDVGDCDEFTLTIVTEIDPLNNTSLEGLYKSGGAFCTQCEAEGFRRITYYLDRPDVMAMFTTKIIADKNDYPYLLSNGNKVEQGELENGQHYVCWQDPFPKPCYLFALVAGDFDVLTDNFQTCSTRDVALEIFVDKGNLAKATHAMASLKRAMRWDEETFGLEYDLDIYMIVAVDFFNMGAMENKGLNVFNSKYVLADDQTATDTDYFNIEAVIGHEYFHNWTGNRVTCRDWFQLSLKEGLTVFRDQQFSADMHSAAVTRIQNVRLLRAQQFAEDAGPMAHPIRPEKVVEMNNFYTLTVYEKGAEVIRMIHTILGVDKFRKGLDLYFSRYDGMAVTCDDFVNAMADASHIDLSLFKAWYSQSGTPELQVTEAYDSKNKQYQLTIKQQHKGSVKSEKTSKAVQALHIPIAIELISSVQTDHPNDCQLLQLTSAEQTWVFDNYNDKPTLAMLAGFTSPVKLAFEQPDHELEQIMAYASDEFCCWDAGQQLLTTYIKKLVENADFSLPQSLISTYHKILHTNAEPAFKAEQLSLPSFDEVIGELDNVDPILVIEAIDKIKHFLAKGLNDCFLDTYRENCHENYANDGKSVGERALKNVCLSYLALSKQHMALVSQQYHSANNITDTLAVLTCEAKNNLADFASHMNDFETKWQETTLVLDKWFSIYAIQSSEDIYQQLESLLAHPLFSLKNPNRARALIASFSVNNHRYFHCLSGRGYQFLGQQVAKLDEINPQVASRLITPLIQYKRFDHGRQKLMREQLVILMNLDNLSKDLKEKLDAALS